MTDAPQQIVINQQPEPSMWTLLQSWSDHLFAFQVPAGLMVGSWLLIAAMILLPKLWRRNK